MSAPAKKTERIELAWVHFQEDARLSNSMVAGVEFIHATETMRLFLGEVAGVPCVFIESSASKLDRVPLTNVASFGVLE